MKLPIRFFGIGILTASIIFAITTYFFNDTSINLEDESIENITTFLEDKGYHVITQEQYISLAVKEQAEQNQNNDDSDETVIDNAENEKEDNTSNNNDISNAENEKEKKENNDKEEEKEKKKPKVHKYTLTVKPNMLGPEVGELLVDNKIIDDAANFAKYLQDKDYSRFIQLGDHKLTSDMTFYEIAEKITSQ